jgi:site-specific DNA-methyltransferase (adenine-specific)
MNELILGDYNDVIPTMAQASVDMVLADLPYAVTKNKWDIKLDLDLLWQRYNHVVKEDGAIVLFAQGLFAYRLALSNEAAYRYDWVWKKGERASGFLDAKKKPLRNHELILVFYRKQPTYNPQFTIGKKANSRGRGVDTNNNYSDFKSHQGEAPNGENKYPKSILNFDRPHPPLFPTQKPVDLCEYLIRTYTNPGDLVLDNCAGSGTTALACLNTGRQYVLIEKDAKNYELARDRIAKHSIDKIEQLSMFLSA